MSVYQLTERAVIRLSAREAGEDVTGFLQGLVTNDVSGELPAYAALLSAQGKTMFDFLVWRDGDALLIECEAEVAPDLVKRLSLYRLRRAIDIAVDGGLRVMWSQADFDGASPDPRLGGLGYRGIGENQENTPSGDDLWKAHRLSLGVAEGQNELGDILWLETNAVELNGVSFEKGCYIGQENTARMNWRQKVNRRLIVVPASHSDAKRNKAIYEDLGLAVDHLRVDSVDLDMLPEWLQRSIKPAD